MATKKTGASKPAKTTAKTTEAAPLEEVTLQLTIEPELLEKLYVVATRDRVTKELLKVVDDALRHHVRDRFGFINKRKRGWRIVMGRLVRS